MSSSKYYLVLLFVAMMIPRSIFALDMHYYSLGTQQSMTVNDTLVTVAFADGSKADVVAFAEGSPVLNDEFEPFPIDPRFWCFKIETGYNSSQALQSLSVDPLVSVVNPAMITADNLLLLFNNEIILKFDDGLTQAFRDSILEANSLIQDTAAVAPRNSMVCFLQSLIPGAVIEVANHVYESAPVVYCHPNFAGELVRHSMPNDEFFPYQWNYYNYGQTLGKPDADIDAELAWDVTLGDPAVIVAVLDDGFQYVSSHLHPDANYAHMLPGKDFGGDSPKFLMPVDNFPSPCSLRTHGMATAGLIFAKRNNSEGMAGLAPSCSLLPVKIFGGDAGNDFCVLPSIGFPSRVAAAIEWAVEQRADILSCSWGCPVADAIAEQVRWWYTTGTAFFFSAGNNYLDSPNGVGFPAFLPQVMAVGATDQWDRVWNYSNKGDSIDVVAPSGGLGGGNIFTLDGVRQTGYVPYEMQCDPATENNYACAFGGTSAACPQVAGIAALILSIRPDLRLGSSTEVKELYRLIKSSAQDRLGDPLDILGWDRYYGWGRVNARTALDSALTGPFVCTWKSGDADGNGLWTISDAVFLISYIFAGGPPPQPHRTGSGDADGNGLVTISDAVYLISYIFGGGPAPWRTCEYYFQ